MMVFADIYKNFYYNILYPNQAYRIAGYCFAAFWIILATPLALALILPGLLLLDFSNATGSDKVKL